MGYVNILANRAAQGIAECERALAINRNFANAHSLIGFAKYCMGRAAETEGHVQEALRLSPRDINAYWWMFCVGMAKCNSARTPKPSHWLRRSIEANRNFPSAHFHLASALALLGVIGSGRIPLFRRDLRAFPASPFVATVFTFSDDPIVCG